LAFHEFVLRRRQHQCEGRRGGLTTLLAVNESAASTSRMLRQHGNPQKMYLSARVGCGASAIGDGNGGKGGNGGVLQLGGQSGLPGLGGLGMVNGIKGGCAGGVGGQGGKGGHGGGGHGGHSAPIAYITSSKDPPRYEQPDFTTGEVGKGGYSGNPAFADGLGYPGTIVPLLPRDAQ
jgi:hypothetical protein